VNRAITGYDGPSEPCVRRRERLDEEDEKRRAAWTMDDAVGARARDSRSGYRDRTRRDEAV
jgi:hypothetical protein